MRSIGAFFIFASITWVEEIKKPRKVRSSKDHTEKAVLQELKELQKKRSNYSIDG
jgi:hypothetical protein